MMIGGVIDLILQTKNNLDDVIRIKKRRHHSTSRAKGTRITFQLYITSVTLEVKG